MKSLEIFDVRHGFCGLLTASNNNLMLFDCGNDGNNFRPSTMLQRRGCTGIEYLFVSNFDNDHVSDLANLRRMFPIHNFYRNFSLNAQQLRSIKMAEYELTDALESAIDMVGAYNSVATSLPPLPGVTFETFYIPYPTVTDTNNLSMITFVRYSGIAIMFTGDMLKPGWERLLNDAVFREYVKATNIFVASHHGRTYQ